VSIASGPHALGAPAAPPAPLVASAQAHLRRLGLVPPGGEAPWRTLGGGVSNWVILFDCGDGVVVKGALARLRVRDEWLADPTRAVLEGRAMAALGARLPAGDLPRVLFVDEACYLLGMSRAPMEAYPWKEALLRGDVDLEVACGVGALLGRVHAATWHWRDNLTTSRSSINCGSTRTTSAPRGLPRGAASGTWRTCCARERGR